MSLYSTILSYPRIQAGVQNCRSLHQLIFVLIESDIFVSFILHKNSSISSTMDARGNEIPCAFDTLMSKNIPDILERIFLSLDYKSFKECMEVNKSWRGLLTSECILVKAKSMFHIEIMNDQNELLQATKLGKVEIVKSILSSVMVDVNCRELYVYGGFNDPTPLCEASAYGHTEVARLLLQNGADPEKTDTSGLTPLYWASIGGHKGVTELLLDAGAKN